MASSLETVSAIVPCLDEEEAIGDVVTGLLANGVDEVVVVDSGSRDGTAARAAAAGAGSSSSPSVAMAAPCRPASPPSVRIRA